LCNFIEIDNSIGIIYLGLFLSEINIAFKIPIAEYLSKENQDVKRKKLELLNFDDLLKVFPTI